MFKHGLTALVVLLTSAAQPSAQQAAGGAPRAGGPTPSVDERVSGLKKMDGYFPLYWDERAGTMLLEIPRFDTEFLFSTGLSAGLGSNDIGLDRGQGGQGRIVTFHRVGPRVLLIQGNQSFRSSSRNPLERKSVEDSFAKSVLWGFAVAAESENRVLDRRHRFLPARRARRRRRAAPGQLPASTGRGARSTCPTPGTSRRTPKWTSCSPSSTKRVAADARRRRTDARPGADSGARGGRQPRPARRLVLGVGRQRHANARLGDAARACLLRRAAGRQLQAAHRRSARRLRRARASSITACRSASR